MPTNYVRMVVGETISEAQANEFETCASAMAHNIVIGTDFAPETYHVLREEGGNMVIMVATFADRQTCLGFHASRFYRAFVAATAHLLVGNLVVKLFTQEAQ